MGSFWLWMAIASTWAAEPQVYVDEDGTVIGRVLVEADAATVRVVLADTAGSLAALSPDLLSVTVSREGRCERVTRDMRGLFRPLRLVTLRCPTAKGWREDLVEGDDFLTYVSEWSTLEEAGRTQVEYRVRTGVKLPVPEVTVTRALVDASRRLLENLVRVVVPQLAPEPPPKLETP